MKHTLSRESKPEACLINEKISGGVLKFLSKALIYDFL